MEKRNMLLTGAPGAGKSTLCATLLGRLCPAGKTQAPEYHGQAIVDLPGEYMTHPHLRRVFLSVLQDVHFVVYVQAADEAPLGIPPGLLQALPGVRLIGVVTKIDLPGADVDRSVAFLKSLGIPEPFFTVVAFRADSVLPLKRCLAALNALPDNDNEETTGSA